MTGFRASAVVRLKASNATHYIGQQTRSVLFTLWGWSFRYIVSLGNGCRLFPVITNIKNKQIGIVSFVFSGNFLLYKLSYYEIGCHSVCRIVHRSSTSGGGCQK